MSTVKYKVSFNQRPAQKPLENSSQPSRVARQLALAYYIEQLIESGELKNYSTAAKMLGLSRARLSQVVNLRFLPIATQEEILSGRSAVSERELRKLPEQII